MSGALLRVEGLRAAYGSVRVLHGVGLEVHAGELVALVGSNGAGKSTLLRTLSGVHPAIGGRVHYQGTDITSAPSHERTAHPRTTHTANGYVSGSSPASQPALRSSG